MNVRAGISCKREPSQRVQVVVGLFGGDLDKVMALSLARPGSIVVDLQGKCLARDGAVFQVSRIRFHLLTALIAARGNLLSRDDLSWYAWGHDRDGGPVDARTAISCELSRCREIISRLQIQVENSHAIGWRVLALHVPPPELTTEMAHER